MTMLSDADDIRYALLLSLTDGRAYLIFPGWRLSPFEPKG